MLNDENIELYLFRYKEGMLDANETAEVERALADHPEWQAMADLYDPSLTLPAGATMHYDKVESLRNGGPRARRRGVVIPLWTKLAAAACLLLFVTTFIKFTATPVDLSQGPLLAGATAEDFNRFAESLPDIEAVQSEPQPAHAIGKRPRAIVADSVTAAPAGYLLAENRPTAPAADVEKPVTTTPVVTPDTLPGKDEGQIFYANIIDWSTDPATSTPTRSQQLQGVAKRATAMVANAVSNYGDHRDDLEESIEERIQSNQFLSNLIAAIQ